MGEEGRLEKGEVGGVRGSGLVQRLVAAQVAPGTPPDELPKPRVKEWVRRSSEDGPLRKEGYAAGAR